MLSEAQVKCVCYFQMMESMVETEIRLKVKCLLSDKGGNIASKNFVAFA